MHYAEAEEFSHHIASRSIKTLNLDVVSPFQSFSIHLSSGISLTCNAVRSGSRQESSLLILWFTLSTRQFMMLSMESSAHLLRSDIFSSKIWILEIHIEDTLPPVFWNLNFVALQGSFSSFTTSYHYAHSCPHCIGCIKQ